MCVDIYQGGADMKSLGIQLVTYNSEAYIDRFLASLVSQTYTDFSLYIWDNASTDKTVALFEQYTNQLDIHVSVSEENINFGQAHNQLYKNHAAELVLLANPDIYLDPHCIERLVFFMQGHKKVGGVAPRLMQWDKKTIDSLGLRLFRSGRVVEKFQGELWDNIQDTLLSSEVEVFGLSGAMPLFRRSALEDVALDNGDVFDSLYVFYKEDVDLAYRLRAAGWSSFVLTNAVAYHDRTTYGLQKIGDFTSAKRKKSQSFQVRYYSYRNHLITLYKNLAWSSAIKDLPWILWYELKKFFWNLLCDRKVLTSLGDMYRLRSKIKKNRQSFLTKHNGNTSSYRAWYEK